MANCTTYVSIDNLIFGDNIRSRACERIPEMVASYKRAGCFKSNHPLVLSAKADNQFLVLVGNRRALGLAQLRDTDPAEYKRICPTGKVPSIVHKNLTREEEVDLRIDHSADEDRVPLDDWSIFLAIKQLVSIGSDSQEEIARKLGLFKMKGKDAGKPNRQIVQPRVNLARLPSFVQDEFRTLCENRDGTAVRWSHLAKLYKLYSAEFVEFPQGNGPEFSAEWMKAKTPAARQEAGEDTAKELSPAAAVLRSQAASSAGLRDALLAATAQGGSDLAQIDGRILEGETAVVLLSQIRTFLGGEGYAELVASAQHMETPVA